MTTTLDGSVAVITGGWVRNRRRIGHQSGLSRGLVIVNDVNVAREDETVGLAVSSPSMEVHRVEFCSNFD